MNLYFALVATKKEQLSLEWVEELNLSCTWMIVFYTLIK